LLARRRDVGALAAFRTAERLAERLAAPHLLVMRVRGFILQALVRLGETERAEHVLSGLGDQDRDRGAKHAALITEIVSLLSAEPSGYPQVAPPRPREAPGETARLIEPLSQSEVRVLRYLPTHLSTSEIARELSVSVNTVRTHMRHLFAKLSVHRRTEAVTRARALGLLAPSPTTPKT
jgi:ATP/maltotriose-dependent transcriptional regulator MalT